MVLLPPIHPLTIRPHPTHPTASACFKNGSAWGTPQPQPPRTPTPDPALHPNGRLLPARPTHHQDGSAWDVDLLRKFANYAVTLYAVFDLNHCLDAMMMMMPAAAAF